MCKKHPKWRNGETSRYTTLSDSNDADDTIFTTFKSPDFLIKDFVLKGRVNRIRISSIGPILNCQEGEQNNINYERSIYFISLPEYITISFDTFDYDTRNDDKSMNPSHDKLYIYSNDHTNTNCVLLNYNTESGTLYYGDIEDNIIINENNDGYYEIEGKNGIYGKLIFDISLYEHY